MFLKSEEQSYSYQEFLERLNKKGQLNNKVVSRDLFTFYSDLIRNLICNFDTILLDDENSGAESPSLEIYKEETNYNLMEVVEKVLNTKAKISLLTSGTTGKPKVISHSVNNFLHTLKMKPEREKDIWALCYNPSHIAGLQVFFQAFLNNNQIVNCFKGINREKILDSRITNISCTPTFFKIYFQAMSPVKGVKRITFGGERVNEKILELASEKFPDATVRNIYASTEAGSLLTSSGEFFEISDENKNVKVVNNELCYWSESEKKWNPSGDLIEYIDSKRFKIIGREKELINIGGYNVFPAEIENLVAQKFDIQDVYVYGRENSVTGRILCMDISIDSEEDKDKLKSDIKSYLKESLVQWKIPRVIKFISNLEIGRTGKRKI